MVDWLENFPELLHSQFPLNWTITIQRISFFHLVKLQFMNNNYFRKSSKQN